MPGPDASPACPARGCTGGDTSVRRSVTLNRSIGFPRKPGSRANSWPCPPATNEAPKCRATAQSPVLVADPTPIHPRWSVPDTGPHSANLRRPAAYEHPISARKSSRGPGWALLAMTPPRKRKRCPQHWVYFSPASAALMAAAEPVRVMVASAAPSLDAKVRPAIPDRSSVPCPTASRRRPGSVRAARRRSSSAPCRRRASR